ncbi:MAG TPA: hypothetical protein PKO36_04580, partial [Candidatus Hydrogenedentes bacterium]|nr:hypothetical protein [Candidatus Hydrogenedentota bacterium]
MLGGGGLCGGSTVVATTDVWCSDDGIQWSLLTEHAPWSPRYEHTSAVFDGKLWILGGRSSSGYLNDVWCSDDGVNWIQTVEHAPWEPASNIAAPVFDGQLWAMKGYEAYSSTDGANWVLRAEIEPHFGFDATELGAGVVFDDRMWIRAQTASDHAWHTVTSTDGANWTPTGNDDHFPEFVLGNRLWSVSDNTYSSADGLTWSLEGGPVHTRWAEREHSFVTLNDKAFYCGVTGSWSDAEVGLANYYGNELEFTADHEWSSTGRGYRWSAACTMFAGKLWMLGGLCGWGGLNDVLSHDPDEGWRHVSASAPWRARWFHSAIAAGGKLWVLGGIAKVVVDG